MPKAAAAPLLATKLHIPRQPRDVVHRPRLNSRLIRSRQPLLTVVSAPAGFGKTTLLTEWFTDSGDGERSTGWLSLDAGDNDASLFWSYFVAALRTVAPDVGTAALSLLQSSSTQLQPAVAALVNDLSAREGNVVVVLDDYHVIESVEVHDSVAFLLEHAPPQFHLVLASRADPPLPLARLRARGELLEIRAADLRFTNEEAALYFNESMGLHLAAGQVGALEVRTEGWIAALQLAALSIQGRDDVARFIENFTGNDRFVVDYLASEVLERQPDHVRDFLLHTAILNRLSGSLCDMVTGRSDGRATLELLDRANLFLVPLDDHREWYRYHHLFADVLRARLLDEQSNRVGELHSRASEWYSKHGDTTEAIEHALAGGDFSRAARLIELAIPTMRKVRQETTFRRWLEALPVDIFHDRPVLSIDLIGARMTTGDTTGVETLLERIEWWLEHANAGDPSASTPIVFEHDDYAALPAQTAVYRAALALLAGDPVATIAHAERVMSLVQPTDHLPQGSATALMGLAHWSVGDLMPACARYREAVQHLVDAGHISDSLGCSLALADIEIAQGRLRDAARTLEAALQRARRVGTLRGIADMHVALGELCIERNQLAEAEEHIQTAASLGEHAGLPQNAYRSRVVRALLLRARGDFRGAVELLEEATPLYNTDFSPKARPIVAIAARTALAHGDLAAATRWADSSGLTVNDDLTYLNEFGHITLARLLLAQRADAIEFLSRLLVASRAGERTGSTIEVLTLLASAHYTAGDRSAATSFLEQALNLAEGEGYIRVFLDVVPSLEPLLRTVTLEGAADKHLRRVVAAMDSSGSVTPRVDHLVDELSSRELHVLRLLRSELSGPDIARELMVSLNTMRTHTKNIYTKLGVNNRREAVRRAAELGL